MKHVTVTDTIGLLALCKDADGRNRSVYTDRLAEKIDPAGTHVLAFQLLHNDVEWRTRWAVKLLDSMEPCYIWLDVGFGRFDKHTRQVEVEG